MPLGVILDDQLTEMENNYCDADDLDKYILVNLGTKKFQLVSNKSALNANKWNDNGKAVLLPSGILFMGEGEKRKLAYNTLDEAISKVAKRSPTTQSGIKLRDEILWSTTYPEMSDIAGYLLKKITDGELKSSDKLRFKLSENLNSFEIGMHFGCRTTIEKEGYKIEISTGQLFLDGNYLENLVLYTSAFEKQCVGYNKIEGIAAQLKVHTKHNKLTKLSLDKQLFPIHPENIIAGDYSTKAKALIRKQLVDKLNLMVKNRPISSKLGNEMTEANYIAIQKDMLTSSLII